MHKTSILLLIITCGIILAISGASCKFRAKPYNPPVKYTLENAKTAEQVYEAMGMGWSYGNQMDAFNSGCADENAWAETKATLATFKGLAAKGFKTVRIPITCLGKVGKAPDYKINEQWLERVVELVGWAKESGLNVIINIQHDGEGSDNWLSVKNFETQSTKEKFAAIWKQLAETFKDEGAYLIFEPYNEIHDLDYGTSDENIIKYSKPMGDLLQLFIDTVRETGGKNTTRWLSCPTYYGRMRAIDSLIMPEDSSNRLMVAIHILEPSEFTVEGVSDVWGEDEHKLVSEEDEEHQETYISESLAKVAAKGYPFYVGDMETSIRDGDVRFYNLYWLAYIGTCLHKYKASPILWDNGLKGFGKTEHHGYIDHSTGEYMTDQKEGSKDIYGDYVKKAVEVLYSTLTTNQTPEEVKANKNYYWTLLD